MSGSGFTAMSAAAGPGDWPGRQCRTMEAIMKFRTLLALVFTALAVSACVVEPYGARGGYARGYAGGYYGGHEDGHRVWH